jgi:predicted O-linked N-acetylglucosamine transferase (SPINDLY family)
MAVNGYVTFGVFNNPSKMTPSVIALWSRILEAVPGARLLLKFRGLEDAAVAAYLRSCFTDCGIDASRLELRGSSPYSEVLAAYREVDLALDTTPYSGTSTTFEALSMGVPVVTLCGTRMVSRSTAAILTAAGLDELVAVDGDSYVALAGALAGDGERLAGLRAGMAERLPGSPLYDVAGFTRDLEALYRGMWREWCAQ